MKLVSAPASTGIYSKGCHRATFLIWAIFGLASGVFLWLGDRIAASGSWLSQLDVEIANTLHAGATEPMIHLAMWITFMGSGVFLIGGFMVIACFLAMKRSYDRLFLACLLLLGGILTVPLLKTLYQRPRPVWEEPILTLQSYSFPSGHVMGSTLFWGGLVYGIFSTHLPWRWKLLSAILAFLLISVIAFTRIYLGVHYVSDTFAGFVGGVGMLAFCIGLLRFFESVQRKEVVRIDPAQE